MSSDAKDRPDHGDDHAGHGHAGDDHAGHDHGALGHSHAPASFGKAFAIGTALNVAFVAVEATYGLIAGSMALLADAGHNLSDVLGLLIAWGAATLAKRRPKGRYTYGLRSSSILAALLNALLLLVAIVLIAAEAIRRFSEPAPVAGVTVMIVAAVGILINGLTAMLFMSGRKGDLNIRGAFLHMAADAAVSAGVVIAGLVIVLTGWSWVDPVVSLLIVVVIAIGTWGLLRDSVIMSLHAAPADLDPKVLTAFLAGQPGVNAVHDLHVWPLSTTETALTAHLVMPAGYPGDQFTADLAATLKEQFGIHHSTVQIETDPNADCVLKPDDVV
ncbi:MAG: cation transporter [Sphingomonas sp.]|uniref:cation diffusion facilitator family transporter n=1 Tax=Sphingomonas sp. TaxID=28214 RepID=UPI001228EDE6|nr:cation diffusion facilitator family transporter [Sphingomonas sp.]THD35077.1 MAG: cation transporter [Sphingomonas sp.]